MSREDERHLNTADLARATESRGMGEPVERRMENEPMQRRGDDAMRHRMGSEPLAALFQGPQAEQFRHRWDEIQIGFVDDPRAAVRNADELVAEVLRTLAESFSGQRSQIEAGLDGAGQPDTERMRIALQRYRSFFQRLLSL